MFSQDATKRSVADSSRLGIQLLVTAVGYDEECKYLNLRLRMEQHRLYAWSETSGLLDVEAKNHERILSSNVFKLHRQTVLDLLVQIRCLFDDFTEQQRKHDNLRTTRDHDDVLTTPEKDAKQANYPMTGKKRDFIGRAMRSMLAKSQYGWTRLQWATVDKEAFERLLAKFATLNDEITNILDHSLQVEIRHTVQDTNRGVLLLHHKISDLSHLVLALKSQLDAALASKTSRMSNIEREANANALEQLAKLAKFKAFNEAIDPKSGTPTNIDERLAQFLELAKVGQHRSLRIPGYLIKLSPGVDESDDARCEATLKTAEGWKRTWVEWKDYDTADQASNSLTKADIVDRVRKLAALLNHSPKPQAFRTPHCLGFFDKADPSVPEEDVDVLDRRLGLVFERPSDDYLHDTLPPVSLRDVLHERVRKPRLTERVKLARALSNCLLYLHTVNWLHKGLRSHNVLFFRDAKGGIDYGKPYLSGFDYSRPGGKDEMTDVPSLDVEHDLYRHPSAQSNRHKERERSKKSFDIYSLGVIFVELAHWKPVETVLGIDLRRAKGKPDMVRQIRDNLLTTDRLAEIGAEMGDRFEEAVKKSLRGGEELALQVDNDDNLDDAEESLSMRFYEEVVKRLEEIVV